jgi:excisionase family DNA binding protein
MIGKPVALIQVPNQRLFGPKAAARYLGISTDLLYEITAEGLIATYDFRGRRAYRLEDLDRFIESLRLWKNGAVENPLPFPRKQKGA